MSEMFLVVLLSLAATSAALPVREATKENEGVNIPVYKPWYNPYGVNVFGSHLQQSDRDATKNYDFTNYFSKYMRPKMMYINFFDNPNIFESFRNVDMFSFMRDFMNYNGMNRYDYRYGPYSQDFMNGNMDYFKNMFQQYFNNPESFKFKNNFSQPQSSTNMNDNLQYPHEYNIKNTQQNNVEGYNYTYKPNFPGYPPSFVDVSYPYNNMNLKYMYYPFHENNDMYRPYSPEYMYRGSMDDLNMKYLLYKYNYPENVFGDRSNYMNMRYPFYNDFLSRMSYGPHGFQGYFDYMRSKRGLTGNVANEDDEDLIRKDPEASDDDQKVHHEVDGKEPVSRSRRDVDSTSTTPEMTSDDVDIEPEVDVTNQGDKEPPVTSDAPIDQGAEEFVERTRYVTYALPQYYYYYYSDPYYKAYPFYRIYTFQPLSYNAYYYKK